MYVSVNSPVASSSTGTFFSSGSYSAYGKAASRQAAPVNATEEEEASFPYSLGLVA